MIPQELLRAGHLDEAIAALGSELREQPSDTQRRMFLFELLCFAGNYDRAAKQLSILADSGPEVGKLTTYLGAVLQAEQTRQSMAASGEMDTLTVDSGPGSWNDVPFSHLEDADPRQCSYFEFIGYSQYHRIPISEVLSVEMDAPARLRDLIWCPARISFRQRPDETIEALIPALTAGACQHADPLVRLGRVTLWEDRDGVSVPRGQRLFQTNNTDWPVLELRNLRLGAVQQQDQPQMDLM